MYIQENSCNTQNLTRLWVSLCKYIAAGEQNKKTPEDSPCRKGQRRRQGAGWRPGWQGLVSSRSRSQWWSLRWRRLPTGSVTPPCHRCRRESSQCHCQQNKNINVAAMSLSGTGRPTCLNFIGSYFILQEIGIYKRGLKFTGICSLKFVACSKFSENWEFANAIVQIIIRVHILTSCAFWSLSLSLYIYIYTPLCASQFMPPCPKMSMQK